MPNFFGRNFWYAGLHEAYEQELSKEFKKITKNNRILRQDNSAPITGDLSPFFDDNYVSEESLGYYFNKISRVFSKDK